MIFYRRSGFADAVVDTLLTPERNGVEVRFVITEGLPTMLGSLEITGLDSVENRAAIVRSLPIRPGGRFDRVALEAARDTIARRLRNSGYPRAVVDNSFDIDDEQRIAHDTITVTTGPFTRIGKVQLEVVPFGYKGKQVPDRIVRSIVGIDSGDVSRSAILEAQVNCTGLKHITSIVLPDTAIAGDVLECACYGGIHRSARLGDGMVRRRRPSKREPEYKFIVPETNNITTRLSKLGGRPVSGGAICASRRDPFRSNC